MRILGPEGPETPVDGGSARNTKPRWMISMLESGFRIVIMTCLSKKVRKGYSSLLLEIGGHDTNAENQLGVENRPPGRRRIRGQASQRRFQRPLLRPPPPQAPSPDEATTLTSDVMQQGMQRLLAAYNQCITRVAQTDDRLEQFRSAVRSH